MWPLLIATAVLAFVVNGRGSKPKSQAPRKQEWAFNITIHPPAHFSVDACCPRPEATVEGQRAAADAVVAAAHAMAEDRRFGFQIVEAIKKGGTVDPKSVGLKSRVFSIPSPSKKGQVLECKEFEPDIFAEIRSALGITEEAYAKSWGYAPDEIPKMDVGAGRSGSLFMTSKDKRFLLKTIPSHEVLTLREILLNYSHYVINHPESRLMRFIGLVRVNYPAVTPTYIHCLIATNIFHAPPGLTMKEKFDLKGRKPKRKSTPRIPAKGEIWKDNQLNRVFYFDPSSRRRTLEGLSNDVDFLMANDCIDYSLLLGVAVSDEGTGVQLGEAEEKLKVPSPVLASNGTEMYFIGIIDFLSRYRTAKKQTAHFFKSFLWEDVELSTVPSHFYANRFMRYLPTVLVEEQRKTEKPESKQF